MNNVFRPLKIVQALLLRQKHLTTLVVSCILWTMTI